MIVIIYTYTPTYIAYPGVTLYQIVHGMKKGCTGIEVGEKMSAFVAVPNYWLNRRPDVFVITQRPWI